MASGTAGNDVDHSADQLSAGTEIDRLPDVLAGEWATVRLIDVLEFRNGVNADKQSYGQGVRFINVLEVITHSHLTAPDIPGRVSLREPLIRSYEVTRGDVVFNRTSETQEEVGLAAVYLDDEKVVFGGFVIRGRFRTQVFDPVYSGYALRASDVRSQIVAKGQGAIRANIGQSDLGKVVVPVPRLEEQQAIGSTLAEVDSLITALNALIAKTRAIKLATMQQLLTGRTRLPGFEGDWETKRLGSLGTFAKGMGIRKDDVESDGLPCVRYGEIYTHHNDFIRRFYSFIDRQVANQSYRLRPGDLLFAGSGETASEIGKCVAFLGGEEAYAGGDIVVFTPTAQDSMFLGYFLNRFSARDQMTRMGQGDAVVHISATNLANLEVSLPCPDEQRAIAQVLSDIDAEIEALEARVAKTRDIKQGMMQQLLTGRIRLVAPASEEVPA